MILQPNIVHTLTQGNIARTHLEITNLTSAVVYISKDEQELSYYESNGYPLKQYAVLKLRGLECYKGAFYGLTDTVNTNVRILEL